MENTTNTMGRFYVERMRRRPKLVLQLLLGTLLNWSNNMFAYFIHAFFFEKTLQK